VKGSSQRSPEGPRQYTRRCARDHTDVGSLNLLPTNPGRERRRKQQYTPNPWRQLKPICCYVKCHVAGEVPTMAMPKLCMWWIVMTMECGTKCVDILWTIKLTMDSGISCDLSMCLFFVDNICVCVFCSLMWNVTWIGYVICSWKIYKLRQTKVIFFELSRLVTLNILARQS
jgi:hypothetical protein